MRVTITQLISYPIKSCAGIVHPTANLDTMGLEHDRQFMLVDEKGDFLSQRKYPQMALIQPNIDEHALDEHVLTVSAPGMHELSLNLTDRQAHTLDVNIWHDSLKVDSFAPEVDQWFSAYLKMSVRLVKYGDSSHRPIDADYNPKKQTVAFADGFPLLVTHEATLNQLNQQLSAPVPMSRFRPNIVLSSGLNACDELNWQRLSNKDCNIDLVKPCSRCVMTGVDQKTAAQTGTEVLKTLKQKFSHNEKPIFGINGLVDLLTSQPVVLSVGQKLELKLNKH